MAIDVDGKTWQILSGKNENSRDSFTELLAIPFSRHFLVALGVIKLFENLLGSLKELTAEREGKSPFSQWRSISLFKAVDYNRRYRHLFIRRVTMSDSTSIVMNNTEVRSVTSKRYNLRLFTYLRDTNLLEIIYIRFADRYFLIYHDDYNKSWCLCIFLLLLQDFIGISWTL